MQKCVVFFPSENCFMTERHLDLYFTVDGLELTLLVRRNPKLPLHFAAGNQLL